MYFTIKQSKTKQNKANQSKAKQSKAKQSKTKQNKAKQSKAKQSKAKKTKQNKQNQTKQTKQSKAKQSKTKQKAHSPVITKEKKKCQMLSNYKQQITFNMIVIYIYIYIYIYTKNIINYVFILFYPVTLRKQCLIHNIKYSFCLKKKNNLILTYDQSSAVNCIFF